MSPTPYDEVRLPQQADTLESPASQSVTNAFETSCYDAPQARQLRFVRRLHTVRRSTVVDRDRATRILLVVYAAGSVAVAASLLLDVGHAGDLADTTSGKILAAALVAMGWGALAAARDPWRNRLMIQVIIGFTALASLAIAYRLAFEDHPAYPTVALLPLAVAAPVLLALFYPRRPSE